MTPEVIVLLVGLLVIAGMLVFCLVMLNGMYEVLIAIRREITATHADAEEGRNRRTQAVLDRLMPEKKTARPSRKKADA